METRVPLNEVKDLTIKFASPRDVILLYTFYQSLSSKTKEFFHPPYFDPKYGLKFILYLITLLFSTINPVRAFLKIFFPKVVILPLIAINENNVIGFAYLKIKSRIVHNEYNSELGIVVREEYQGMGVGSKLMQCLLNNAQKEKISRIRLIVDKRNEKAIHLYKKFGFKITRMIENGDFYDGKCYTIYEMMLKFKKA